MASDQLFYIRAEQVFGLLSVIYLYVALIISPLTKVFGERHRLKHLVFARRAIGVSSAYFAALHIMISVWAQIGGLSGIELLPARFKISFALGAVAFTVLLIMASTSFDKIIKIMTLRRWKWLHRLVYIAIIFIILHVWMIGTHMVYSSVRVTAFVALAIFFSLESYRIILNLSKTRKSLRKKDDFWISVCALSIFWIVILLAIPQLVENHHTSTTHGGSSQDSHE